MYPYGISVGGIVLLIVLIMLLVWLGIRLIAAVVGIDLAGQDTLAASIHLTVLALLFGALERRGAARGSAAA